MKEASDIKVTSLSDFGADYHVHQIRPIFKSVVTGMNSAKDIMGVIRDVVGGRVSTIEKTFDWSIKNALHELQKAVALEGYDGVVGVDYEYSVIGPKSSIIAVHVTGMMVRIVPVKHTQHVYSEKESKSTIVAPDSATSSEERSETTEDSSKSRPLQPANPIRFGEFHDNRNEEMPGMPFVKK